MAFILEGKGDLTSAKGKWKRARARLTSAAEQ